MYSQTLVSEGLGTKLCRPLRVRELEKLRLETFQPDGDGKERNGGREEVPRGQPSKVIQ